MNLNTTKTKDLIINGMTVGKYEYTDDILFLKVILKPTHLSLQQTEDFFLAEIEKIENKKFTQLSFLNIPD